MVQTSSELLDLLKRKNQSAGDSVAAAVLALHRALPKDETAQEAIRLLHSALNDMTMVVAATEDLKEMSYAESR